MALYEYKSDDGKVITISRSMKSKIPAKVTRKGIVYHRVWTVPSMAIDMNKPKTVGAIAEKNTQKMIDRGDKTVKAKKDIRRPFWRDTDEPMKNLNSLTRKQKQNYIRTGKTS